jgi:hypothetical protein
LPAAQSDALAHSNWTEAMQAVGATQLPEAVPRSKQHVSPLPAGRQVGMSPVRPHVIGPSTYPVPGRAASMLGAWLDDVPHPAHAQNTTAQYAACANGPTMRRQFILMPS